MAGDETRGITKRRSSAKAHRGTKILLLPQCCPKVAPFARLLTAALVDGRWDSGHRRRLLRTIGSAKAGPRVGAARIQMPRWLALLFFSPQRGCLAISTALKIKRPQSACPRYPQLPK